jgi:hypothetical protein
LQLGDLAASVRLIQDCGTRFNRVLDHSHADATFCAIQFGLVLLPSACSIQLRFAFAVTFTITLPHSHFYR